MSVEMVDHTSAHVHKVGPGYIALKLTVPVSGMHRVLLPLPNKNRGGCISEIQIKHGCFLYDQHTQKSNKQPIWLVNGCTKG